MNLAVTLGNFATSLLPYEVSRAYADRALRRLSTPLEGEGLKGDGSTTVSVEYANDVAIPSPALWKHSWPRLAKAFDVLSTGFPPVRALAYGAGLLHKMVLYDGLKSILGTTDLQSPLHTAAAWTIGDLGPDYLEDTIRRLLAEGNIMNTATLGKRALTVLRHIIETETEPETRQLAIESLLHMGAVSGETLKDLMSSQQDTDVRFAVARAIVSVQSSQRRSAFVTALHDVIPRAFQVYREYVQGLGIVL